MKYLWLTRDKIKMKFYILLYTEYGNSKRKKFLTKKAVAEAYKRLWVADGVEHLEAFESLRLDKP